MELALFVGLASTGKVSNCRGSLKEAINKYNIHVLKLELAEILAQF